MPFYLSYITTINEKNPHDINHASIGISEYEPPAQPKLLLKVGLFGNGQIKLEDFIKQTEGRIFKHKTFKISNDELAKVLHKINTDRRKNLDLNPQDNKMHEGQHNNQDSYQSIPGGVQYNTYMLNCKTYALSLLDEININHDTISNWGIDNPKHSGPLHPLETGVEITYHICPPYFTDQNPKKCKVSDLFSGNIDKAIVLTKEAGKYKLYFIHNNKWVTNKNGEPKYIDPQLATGDFTGELSGTYKIASGYLKVPMRSFIQNNWEQSGLEKIPDDITVWDSPFIVAKRGATGKKNTFFAELMNYESLLKDILVLLNDPAIKELNGIENLTASFNNITQELQLMQKWKTVENYEDYIDSLGKKIDDAVAKFADEKDLANYSLKQYIVDTIKSVLKHTTSEKYKFKDTINKIKKQQKKRSK